MRQRFAFINYVDEVDWPKWGNREDLAPRALALEKSGSYSAPNGKPIFIIGIYMTHYWFGKWCGSFLLHFPGPSLVKCLFFNLVTFLRVLFLRF